MNEDKQIRDEKVLEDKDFPYICRICQGERNLIPFQEQPYLIEIFKLMTNIEVRANPDMPQNICKKCINKLQDIGSFITNCQETENMLQSLLANKQIRIKTEIVEPDDSEPMETGMMELVKDEVQECEVKEEWDVASESEELYEDTSQTPSDSMTENHSRIKQEPSLMHQYSSEDLNMQMESISSTSDWKNGSTYLDETNDKNEIPLEPVLHVKKENKTTMKSTYSRKGYCMYCQTEVTNFLKHLERTHLDEPEIKHIFSEPPGTTKRRQMITSLRKRGNCVANSVDLKHVDGDIKNPLNVEKENEANGVIKKKEHTRKGYCIYCQSEVGHLVKHMEKQHLSEPEIEHLFSEPPGSTKRKQMIFSLRKKGNYLANSSLPKCIDNNLRTYVFPSMKFDEKSFVAKNDEIICAFGAKYLKRLGTNNHNVISTRMRLLGAFLIQIQKIDSSIPDILTVLQPKYWNLITMVICVLAKYDSVLGRYESPSVMFNCVKYITDCCKLALEQQKTPEGIDLLTYHKGVQELCSYFRNNLKWNPNLPEIKLSGFRERKEFDDAIKKNQANTSSTSLKSGRRIISWSLDQKKIVLEYFNEHIKEMKCPKRHECELLKEKYSPLFDNKSWEKIKAFVFNEYRLN